MRLAPHVVGVELDGDDHRPETYFDPELPTVSPRLHHWAGLRPECGRDRPYLGQRAGRGPMWDLRLHVVVERKRGLTESSSRCAARQIERRPYRDNPPEKKLSFLCERANPSSQA
jgi:hypothetical protein